MAFKWREQAEAYDRHKLYEQTWVEERRKAAESDAKILNAAIGKLAQRLPSLNAVDLSPGDKIRLMDVTVRHRRILGDMAAAVARRVAAVDGHEDDDEDYPAADDVGQAAAAETSALGDGEG
ncbi:hypothetical protein [Nonomuraea dietziae]|uniref:hypothetical protein n=1 Tax=Nonomuraea dietziae TaxID=65515 RepID=UPI003438AEE6